MKKFWSYFILSVVIIVAVFFLVSLIMSNIHDVTMVAEWKNWLEAIGIIKEATEPAIKTASNIKLVA